MNSREKYEYWLEAGQYDLESARVMMDSGRYMYVAFMCQQSIEKLAKGIYTLYTEKEPPRVHNIWNILKKLKEEISLKDYFDLTEYQKKEEIYKNFFAELMAFYISGRYPSYSEKISSNIDEKRAKRILSYSEEVFLWLESLNQYKK